MKLRTFAQTWGHSVSVKLQRKEGPLTFEILFDAEMPDELSLILSDALHNLRTVLDHATWELIGLDNGTRNRHTKFPTGKDKPSFEAACKGIMTPRQETITFFSKLAVYPKGAGDTLYLLSQLDNAEKHTVLAPVFQAASVKRIVFIDLATGDRLVAENTVLSAHDGRAFLTALPGYGIDCNDKFETTGTIVFGDVEGVPRQPVLPTLMRLHDAVARTLWQFREFTITRSK